MRAHRYDLPVPALDLTLAEIRQIVGGKLVGDASFRCRAVAVLEEAGPDELSFVKDRRYLERAAKSRAGALLVPERIAEFGGHQLVVEQPLAAFGRLLAHIARVLRRHPPGIHPTAAVDPSAEIGEGVAMGPGVVVREGAVVGNGSLLYANAYLGQRSRLGRDCVLYPNVVLMEDVIAGDRLIVHGGAVIGAEGYGYVPVEGRHQKVPQVGEIVIGDDVEIGALATIDRATMARTTIGRGTKIGDLAHIAHNCTIGEDVLLLPTVAVSGSVTVGDRALLAGRAGTSDNIRIGEGAILGGTAVAFKDVPPGAQMWGNPAREKSREIRIQAALTRLPEMQRELRRLRQKVEQLAGDRDPAER